MLIANVAIPCFVSHPDPHGFPVVGRVLVQRLVVPSQGEGEGIAGRARLGGRPVVGGVVYVHERARARVICNCNWWWSPTANRRNVLKCSLNSRRAVPVAVPGMYRWVVSANVERLKG